MIMLTNSRLHIIIISKLATAGLNCGGGRLRETVARLRQDESDGNDDISAAILISVLRVFIV